MTIKALSCTAATAVAIATAALTACTTEQYDAGDGKYSYLRSDFAEVTTDGQARMSSFVTDESQVLAASYAEVPALKATIDNPMLSKSQKGDLLTSATGSTSCELTKRFIGLVLDEGRENIMQFIANSFITLYRKQNNLIKARLVTASQPSQQVEARLRQLVGSKTSGSKVEFVSEVDPDIIGGFVLEYDTYRMDASIKTQLSAILSKLK